MQQNHVRFTRTIRTLPLWLWGLIVICCAGDVGTTLLALRVGLTDSNPLYTGSAATPWLLLLTHGAVLVILAAMARRARNVAALMVKIVIGAYIFADLHNLLAILPHLTSLPR